MKNLLHKRLKKELEQRKKDSIFRRLKVHSPDKLNLSSNDYLQLRQHPKLIKAAQKAIKDYGTSSSASPLLTGYLPCHDELLKTILDWKKKNHGVIFNSGYVANQTVLKNLPGSKDLILADKLVHHSIIQALGQSRAKFKRYHHLNLNHLEELLSKFSSSYENIFVVSESIFSMDGDYPDLKKIAQLKKLYSFIFILDEAHGTGVFGPTGGGVAEEMEIIPDVDILIGTLGKSLASMGAYILTNSSIVKDYLINFSGELIYSTFLPPSCAAAAIQSIDIVKKSSKQRNGLRKLGVWFRNELLENGWNTNSFDSQIIPIIIKDSKKTVEICKKMYSSGIDLGAIRPPTVPNNTSRLRVSLHSGITEENLFNVLQILKKSK